MSGPHEIRVFGDPVLRTPCADVREIDSTIIKLAEDMIDTMYASNGVGVAAPQVGVGKRLFVYDAGSGPFVLINPKIIETSGEWEYDEGCLSIPGMFFPIVRPARVVVEGLDIDGKSVREEANELLGRILQHEVDHLDGMMLISRLDPEHKKAAVRELRARQIKSRS